MVGVLDAPGAVCFWHGISLPRHLPNPLPSTLNPEPTSSQSFVMAAFGPVNSAQGAIAIAQNSNKFSGLPDIDTSAVDVYETPSSPELKPIKHTSRNNTSGGAGLRDYDDSEESDDPVDGDASIPGEDEAVAAARRRRRKAQQADDGRGEIDRRGITTEEARIRFQGSTDISAEGKTAARKQEAE